MIATLKDKRWLFAETPNNDDVQQLSEQLRVDPTLASLLVQRDIATYEEARTFFRPSLNDLHDPFLLNGMREAIGIIEEIIISNQKILIYGDYDVDGTTAVALLYSYLGQYYNKLGYYIPDRHSEGYGLSFKAIDWAKEHDYKLIITLDCGITAVDQVNYASEKGIEVIISDHHLPGETLPDAGAILNPKLKNCNYPFKELSGCGIGFKLAQAFALSNNIDLQPLFNLLDLVVVSIASDIVPIIGENRTLAYFGLKKLSENPGIGLKAIKDICLNKTELTISDIVFNIGPRINAAGRMGDAKTAVRLLISKNKLEADEIAASINTTNSERKDIDSTITGEAIHMARNLPNASKRTTTIVWGENWHKGVIGIVASRLIEIFYRPTIVFTLQDGKYTGSARSVTGFDIYNAIHQCGELVEQFGGHKYAAGLSIKEENIEAFTLKFEQVVQENISEDLLIPRVDIDLPLKLNQINDKFFRILRQFAPFGPGNMQPVFFSETVFATEKTRIVGDNHLMLYVKQEDSTEFQAIAFRQGDHAERIMKGIPFNMCYTIEENVWNGKTTLKITIKDIKFGL